VAVRGLFSRSVHLEVDRVNDAMSSTCSLASLVHSCWTATFNAPRITALQHRSIDTQSHMHHGWSWSVGVAARWEVHRCIAHDQCARACNSGLLMCLLACLLAAAAAAAALRSFAACGVVTRCIYPRFHGPRCRTILWRAVRLDSNQPSVELDQLQCCPVASG